MSDLHDKSNLVQEKARALRKRSDELRSHSRTLAKEFEDNLIFVRIERDRSRLIHKYYEQVTSLVQRHPSASP